MKKLMIVGVLLMLSVTISFAEDEIYLSDLESWQLDAISETLSGSVLVEEYNQSGEDSIVPAHLLDLIDGKGGSDAVADGGGSGNVPTSEQRDPTDDSEGTHYDTADRDTISEESREEIDEWRDLSGNSLSDKIKSYAMTLLVLSGIILIVWSMLFYLGFWIDQYNIFFDLSVITLFTLGKLRTSGSEEDSNFNDTTKTGTKFINHKDALKVTAMGMIFGGLIVSGVFYSVISWSIAKAHLALSSSGL